MGNKKGFKKELEQLLNKYSIDNDTNTPDFILADYLTGCIKVYNKTTVKRDDWSGRGHGIIELEAPTPELKSNKIKKSKDMIGPDDKDRYDLKEILDELIIITAGTSDKPDVHKDIQGKGNAIGKIIRYYSSTDNNDIKILKDLLDTLKIDIIGGHPSSNEFIRGKGTVITVIITYFNNKKELNDNAKYITAIEDLLSELRIDEISLGVMANGYSPDYPGAVDLRVDEKWTNPLVKVQLSQVVAQKLYNLIK
jgi:hypothetical protein